uniref:NADH dehydrogenase subunit 2 n=1 Tax=Homoneura picta TaxID=2892520 RepID=UPI0023F05057|nr:NADH dehydrogenase subunit 2 [Homoneura picta]WEW51815.1 NADH dehydrogenase subunit 2 [Homoneura picta]WGM80961.1 NADH dehydrogenase subunit 2 [Homoneura picta]
MFNNSSKIMFILILMMGTMITVSANSWLSAWMGLEINLLSFIPLMSDTNNLMSTEASLKYFLTQALASSVLLFAIIMFLMESNLIIFSKKIFSGTMILSALLLKSGTAPFHFWFPNVMEGLSWINALILMTWQKIAPLMLISYLQIKTILLICIILSTIIGSLGGLNQTSLRKLMAYSSINHLGWMLAAMYSSETLWFTYFLFYSFLSVNLVFFFNLFKLFHINQLFTLYFSSKPLKFSLFFNLLSLGGLPPFLGFLPKWFVIQTLSISSQLFLMSLLTVMTLVTLYFYLRLCYSAFMMNYYEPLWVNSINSNNFYFKISLGLSFISTFGLMAISLIYLFL